MENRKPQTRKPSLASTAFDQICGASGETNREIGERLGVSSSLISAVRRGVSQPSKSLRIVIESTYSIPRADWDTPLGVEEAKPDPIKEALRVVVEKMGYRLL